MKTKDSFGQVATCRNENVLLQASPISILLAEADVNWGRFLRDYLIKQGFSVSLFTDGQDAWRQFDSEQFNFCIINPALPTMSGIALAEHIRKRAEHIPMVFIVSHQDDTENTRTACFMAGGDDFLLRPQCLQDLAFRIRAIQKRFCFYSLEQRRRVFDLGKWRFDCDNRWLFCKQESIRLTHKETALLYVLCLNRGRVLALNQALEAVWNSTLSHNIDGLNVYICRLRRLLEKYTNSVILNERGIGFKLVTYRVAEFKRINHKMLRPAKPKRGEK